MPVDAQTKENAVNSAIREISHIATLPEITLKIIQLVESPTSTAQDLHKVISNDPALCSRILKVVNSAFYGLPGQVGSINRAIVLLGLNAVKNIAIAASLTKLFRGGAVTPNFAAKDLWEHSIAVGAASKMIADSLKLAFADEAFLAGLIHDLGIVVELQFDRNKLVEAVTRTNVGPDGTPARGLLDTEDEVFGATHQDFGSGLCIKWKFPKSFANVTGYHHRPLELADDGRTLACIVAIADRLAACVKKPFRLDLTSIEIPSEFLDHIKLTRDASEDIKNKLSAQMETMSQMLN
ncbi:MAG: HDOD domain-containing protein [Phycisphaerales bacterium]